MINFGGRKKKTTFCVRIFDISPCVFTQISIGRARWMRNLIPHPTSSPDRNLSKNTMRYVENMNKKSSFFLMTNMLIQPLWLTYFIEILLVLEFQLTKTYFGTFSYKAHFRPQISSNENCHSWKQILAYWQWGFQTHDMCYHLSCT